MSEFTRFEVVDNIGIVTLCRPPVNAMNVEIKEDMCELFESVNDGRVDIHCIIICSDQKGFCGGSDTKEWYHPDAARRARNAPLINRMQNAIYRCNVPVICAVNGFCVGLGFAIASVSDVIIAEKNAWFSFPEINVGTVGGPAWLTRIMSEKMARYYLLTGEKISADEMYRLGVVFKVVEKADLMDEAMAIARKFTAKYPPALWAIKTLMNETEAEVQDLIEITARMRMLGNRKLLSDDPNKKEMTMAFNEKRKPVYDMGGLAVQQQKIKAYRDEHPHFEL
jgi:enoyl-CoA hydratase